MRKKWLHSFALCTLPFALLLGGCTLATQQDLQKLDDDVSLLRKNQADLVVKMNDLSGNLQALNSQLESSQQQMGSLSNKLDYLQADLTRRMSVLSGQVTGTSTSAASTPEDQYRIAYNDYTAGKYDLALVGLRNFISQYPRNELAAEAQFHVGECEYARKNWNAAVIEFDRVVQNYPKSDSAPKALFKKASALQQAHQSSAARETFKMLIKVYPRSEQARSARDALSESHSE